MNKQQNTLPDGWREVRLDAISSVVRGRFSARPRNNPIYYGGNIPFLQTGDISNDKNIVYKYSQTLNQKGLEVSKLFPKGSLILSIAANIGDIAEVGFDFACPDSLIVIQVNNGTNNQWLKYNLKRYKAYFLSRATQNAQANINLEIVRPVLLALPPIAEQKAIASVLSCWDNAIDASSEKIKLLKLRKKGLMQKLLSPKPHWIEKKLGDICDYKNGGAYEKNVLENGKYSLITLNSIDIFGDLKFKHKTINLESETLKKNDIIMVLSDIAHGNFLGLTALILEDDKFVLNQRMGLLRVKSNDFSHFIRKFINHNQQYFKRHGQGSSQQNLSKGDILSFKIHLPPLSEQKEIANILSTVDNEIDLWEQKLENIKTQKKALMQKLLTGRWRIL